MVVCISLSVKFPLFKCHIYIHRPGNATNIITRTTTGLLCVVCSE